MKNEELKLEVGKTYLTRNGERVEIIDCGFSEQTYPFTGDNNESYMPNGRWYDMANDQRDLIALADDEPAERLDMGESEPQMATNWPALANVPQQTLKVKRLHPDAVLPTYATDGSACFDLRAVGINGFTVAEHSVLHRARMDRSTITMADGDSVLVNTGLAVEVPPGHALLIFSRSGHGFNYDTRLANCVGVIDSDYRGEIVVKLTRDISSEWPNPLRIRPGDRIAQAMLVPIPRVKLVEVEELSDTARGAGGFGSTGA